MNCKQRYGFTNEQMKQLDNYAINKCNMTSLQLMANAARSVVKHITQATKVLIVCGTGNNGADGLAVGRFIVEGHHTLEFDEQLEMLDSPELREGSVKLLTKIEDGYDVLVDAML